MSKPVLYSLIAMTCYAISNVILELKFSKFNNLTLLCGYMVPILLLAVLGRELTKTTDPSFNFPAGMDLVFLVLLGVILFTADYFYVGAYTSGGSLLTITSLIVMFPAVASVIKLVVTRDLPNMWQVSGYLLAVGATLLIARGNTS